MEKYNLNSTNSQQYREQKSIPLDPFYDICSYMHSVSDLETLTAYFVKSVADILGVNKVSFMLLDESKGELALKASQGLDASVAGATVKLGESISGKVAADGKPLLVRDVEEEMPDHPVGRMSRYASKSFIIAPVVVKEKVIGVLSVTDRKSSSVPFDQYDLKMLRLLSHYFALHVENARLLEKNKSIAILDPMTGLYNHRYFQEQLLEEIYRAERYKCPLTLILVDIDKFSEYNQTHGYSSGDSVLNQIGKLIKSNIRQVDLLSHYGADEFSIILPETKVKEAIFVGEKIREKIGFSVFTENENRKSGYGMARLTVSIGIAEYRVGLTKEELIHQAQAALFQAQQKGRNCVCVFK